MRLLHLAPMSRRGAILRGGIAAQPTGLASGRPAPVRGVYAMPVVADFWTTYQWLRELRSRHGQRMVAVHFRIPDDEPVHVGRYWETHQRTTAAAAAAWVMANPQGAEVVVPRKIPPKEILRVVEPGQLVGWTGSPTPSPLNECVCFGCLPTGVPKFMRRVRAAYERGWSNIRSATDTEQLLGGLRDLYDPLERARGRIAFGKLLRLLGHAEPSVRAAVAGLMSHGTSKQVAAPLTALLGDPDAAVRAAAAESLIAVVGCRRAMPALLRAPVECQRALLAAAGFERDDAVAAQVFEQLRRRGDASLRADIDVAELERQLS
jgi:HEAT repeats